MIAILCRFGALVENCCQTSFVYLHHTIIVDVDAMTFWCSEAESDVKVTGVGSGVELLDKGRQSLDTTVCGRAFLTRNQSPLPGSNSAVAPADEPWPFSQPVFRGTTVLCGPPLTVPQLRMLGPSKYARTVKWCSSVGAIMC